MKGSIENVRPLIQAPMAGVQDWRLAAAVSQAGGLGSLPVGMLNTEQLEQQLIQLGQATSKPFNVNFFCHASPAPDPEGEQRWTETLQPYYDEFSADTSAIPEGPSRKPFDSDCAAVLE